MSLEHLLNPESIKGKKSSGVKEERLLQIKGLFREKMCSDRTRHVDIIHDSVSSDWLRGLIDSGLV